MDAEGQCEQVKSWLTVIKTTDGAWEIALAEPWKFM